MDEGLLVACDKWRSVTSGEHRMIEYWLIWDRVLKQRFDEMSWRDDDERSSAGIGWGEDTDEGSDNITEGGSIYLQNMGRYNQKLGGFGVLEEVNPEGSIDTHQRGVSVKGNTYFFAHHFIQNHGRYAFGSREEVFLLCFDFTKERFGPRLPLPFDSFDGFNDDLVTLSSFLRGDDEQLAVLFGGYESGFFEIWVTLTVEPNRASWSKFLRMEPGPFSSYDGYFKTSVNLGEALILEHQHRKAARPPLVCSYRPSLVQVKHPLETHVSSSQKETHVSLPAQRSSVLSLPNTL
ncbi:hypothetical protein Bca101_099941 [Brassica carinata]